jgi:hypothetical protein
MVRALALALALATAVCGVKGSPRPPLPQTPDAGTRSPDAGVSADGGGP